MFVYVSLGMRVRLHAIAGGHAARDPEEETSSTESLLDLAIAGTNLHSCRI